MSVQRSRALYVLVALTAGCARSFTGPPEPHPDGAEPFCSEGGFCWVTPRPQGNALLAVDVSETGDAVAVGRGGAALLLDERGISELDLDTHDDLVGAWVAPDGAVWAAPQIGWGSDGGELVYFREGLSIRVPAPGTGAIAGLDGVSATDVLFGQDGVLYRGGPEGFRPYFAPAEPELRVVDVVVRSADDVWVLMATPAIPDGPVGDAVAFHLRGPDADVVARVERAEREVTGLTATGDGTLVAYGHGVFAVSDAGFVDLGLDDVGTVHAAAGADLEHLWLLTATGTYLGGRRQGDNDLFLALASREDGTQIVRVGDRGAMGALVDDAWIDIAVGTPAVPAPLDPDAFGTVPPAIWVGEARAAWAASPTDAWRVRDDRRYFAPFDAVLEHWDGARWTSVRDAGWSCTRIHGSAADDVWVAGGTR
ncbi:MAG: hypothetical protein KC619_01980, partial [Myxococcales bacterium]|nr:hypothetical protein [Myxococcales bacterium]